MNQWFRQITKKANYSPVVARDFETCEFCSQKGVIEFKVFLE